MNTPKAAPVAVEAADLLPCPFCGEKPELHSWHDTSCKDNFTLACCARMESTEKSALFSNWNNRAELASPLGVEDADIESIRQALQTGLVHNGTYAALSRIAASRPQEVVS